jgi:hypothetical protein
MPKIAVNKSIIVAVSPDKAYETIRDFHQWNRWSPWVICEPDCQMTYADIVIAKNHFRIQQMEAVSSGD